MTAKLRIILSLAVSTLLENPLRSTLTLLGIMFGSASVIATLSSSEGAQLYLNKQMQSLGTNVMIVESKSQAFAADDLVIVDSFIEGKDLVALDQPLGEVSLSFDSNNVQAGARAADSPYFTIHRLNLSSGRTFTAEEKAQLEPVAILGGQIKDRLFGPNRSYVGKSIFMKNSFGVFAVRVIGSFHEKGGSDGLQYDQQIFLNPSYAEKVFGSLPGFVLNLHLKNPENSGG